MKKKELEAYIMDKEGSLDHFRSSKYTSMMCYIKAKWGPFEPPPRVRLDSLTAKIRKKRGCRYCLHYKGIGVCALNECPYVEDFRGIKNYEDYCADLGYLGKALEIVKESCKR